MALGALIGALAWGAFAFGAYYPWAYWPLVVVALLVGLAGLLARSSVPPLGLSWLAAGFAIFLVAGLVQLIPLSMDTLRAISPEAPGIITQLNPLAALGLVTTHPLSLAPRQTLIALAVVGSLMVLVIGAARLFSIVGVRRIASAITIIGVLLALEGIVQRRLSPWNVYGFWTTNMGGNPFGPFVNRNHFAGWMLMALPLTLGLVGGRLARGMPGSVSGLRDRVLWLSSPEGSRLSLWIGAAGLMALSLILTMSRSGMAVAVLVVIAVALRVLTTGRTLSRGIAGAALVCAAAVGVVAWIGADAIAERFGEADWEQVSERTGAWQDAVDIWRRYPLAGTGFNTYGVATLFYQQHGLDKHFAQAHNDYLQLAAEGGLLLMTPAAGCVALFFGLVRRRFREETSVSTSWIRFGAVIGIAAVALQETVEFSLQMPGNALLFAVLCAIALHRTPLRHRPAQLSGVK